MEALKLIAAHCLKEPTLTFGFNSFRSDRHMHSATKIDDGPYNAVNLEVGAQLRSE